jgi:hypothetical protein
MGWGLLGAGVVALAGKLMLPAGVAVGMALALAVPLAGAVVALLRRRRPSLVEAAIVLDRRGGLGGFPLLFLDHPESEWARHAAEGATAAVPRLALGFYARRLLPSLLFFLATLIVPRQEGLFSSLVLRRDSAAKREVQKLAGEMKKIEEKKVLPEQEIERMRQELKSLEATAEKKALTQEAWEGLDHLSEQMRRAMQEQSSQMSLAAATAERLAATLSASKLDEAAKMEQIEALKRAMIDLPMTETVRKALENPDKLDPDALKKALGDLKEFLDGQLADCDKNHEEG